MQLRPSSICCVVTGCVRPRVSASRFPLRAQHFGSGSRPNPMWPVLAYIFIPSAVTLCPRKVTVTNAWGLGLQHNLLGDTHCNPYLAHKQPSLSEPSQLSTYCFKKGKKCMKKTPDHNPLGKQLSLPAETEDTPTRRASSLCTHPRLSDPHTRAGRFQALFRKVASTY